MMTVTIQNDSALPVQVSASVQTMSSREIAELTGKRHADVCRDVRRMLGQLGLAESNFASSYVDRSRKRSTEYLLPRRECEILVTGYDVKRRAAVIDRWFQLETHQNRQALPSVKELAQMVIQAEEEKERAFQQIERDRPKVAFAESVKSTTNNIDLSQCAKRLGVGPYKLRDWLRKNKVLMADNVPYQRFLDGRFEMDTRVRKDRNKQDVSYQVTMVTPRGFIWLEKHVRELLKAEAK